MLTLKGYSDIKVIQRNSDTGCIPTGIEWILRYLNIPNVNFEGFQERHNLGKNNSFYSVRIHVMAEVPSVKLVDRSFPTGREKIEQIKKLINESRPCLISIASLRCHIVPVVEISDNDITVLWLDKATVEEQKRIIPLTEIEQRHNILGHGTDILFVAEP